MRPSSLTALIVGLGGLNLILLGLVILGIVSFSGTNGGAPAGTGPMLGVTAPAPGSSAPAIGGLYSCDTCRGYPSGPYFTRDSWRWF